MKSIMATPQKITLVSALVLLSACSVEYKVTQLPAAKVTKELQDKGIFYSLPKTQIVANVEVQRTLLSIGKYARNFDENLKNCKANPKGFAKVYSDSFEPPQYAFKPVVSTVALADKNHLYRLEIDKSLFSSFTHTIELGETGILQSAESQLTNNTAVFASAVFQSTLSTVAALAAGGAKVQLDPQMPCGTFIANTKTAVTEQEMWKAKVKEIEEEAQTALKDFLSGAGTPRTDKALDTFVKIVAAEKAAKLKEAKKAFPELPMIEINKKKIEKFALIFTYVPVPFETKEKAVIYDTAIPIKNYDVLSTELFQLSEKEGRKRLSMPRTKALLDEMKLGFKIEPSTWPNLQNAKAASTKDPGKGFVYRLPAKGRFTLNATIKGEDGKDKKEIIVQTPLSIAQYGPIARLASKIEGTKGNILLKLRDDGSASKITLGSEAIDSKVFSGNLDAVNKFIEARKGAELKDLQEKRDLLKTRKEIRDLEEELLDSGDEPESP